MDVNGLHISDEFRMRSPVVWLCIGIVLLYALGVESGMQRSFHLIQGQSGPIFRSFGPSIGGNRYVAPAIVKNREQRQEIYEEEDEDEEDEEEEEEAEENEYEYEAGYDFDEPAGDPGDSDDYETQELENEEEEEEDEEEDEDDVRGTGASRTDDGLEGRQAYVNNQYIEQPYHIKSDGNRVKPQSAGYKPQIYEYNGNRRPSQGKPNKHHSSGSSNKKPSKSNKRKPKPHSKPTSSISRPTSYIHGNVAPPKLGYKEKETTMPQKIISTVPSVSQQESSNQKIQLRPVTTSTQFIATPVADLILRLSISLAKAVGHGNLTSFNVPIRIRQTPMKTVDEKDVIHLDTNKVEVEVSKPKKVALPDEKHKDDDINDDNVDEEKEASPTTPAVTELPRK